jgi:large subunit ribosomal protein L29
MAKEIIDFNEMSEEGLATELSSLENQLIQMKFDHAAKGIANPMELRELRREIARAHTEMRSRALAAMSADELEMRSKLRARRRRQR